MRSFLILLSLVNAHIICNDPLLGAFFVSISCLACMKRMGGYGYLIFHITLTAVLTTAVFILSERPQLETVQSITITEYKYYREGLGHMGEADDNSLDVYVPDGIELPIGTRCAGPFPVEQPEATRNFIKYDAVRTMKVNGMDGRIYMDSGDLERCRSQTQPTLHMKIAQARDAYMRKVLASTAHDYKYDILTLSIGNKSYITSEFFDALQKLGIYHLYVISGTHVAFIGAVIFHILNRFRLEVGTIRIIMMVMLLLFLALNFPSPSVFRAVLMTITLLMLSFTRHRPYLTVISLSAIIQIVMNPWIVYHAGFQLSYLTTFAIVLSKNYWMHHGFIGQLISITLIAEISTVATVLMQFNELSISGIVMNMVYVPIFTLVFFPMVIFYNCLVFIGIPQSVDFLYALMFNNLKGSIVYLADMMTHRIAVKNLSAVALIIVVIASYRMIRALCLREMKSFILSLLALITTLVTSDAIHQYDVTVTMVDVGQGDAFVLTDHMNDRTILIDTGGRRYLNPDSKKLSDQTVLPFLKEAGINNIDLMILSHFDLDHVGEAKHIMEELDVEQIYLNPFDPSFKEWYADLSTVQKGRVVDAMESPEIEVGAISIRKLFPVSEVASDDSNQHSLVLEVSAGAYTFLFTGDADMEGEAQIMERHGSVHADVLKLGHHGSNTSTGEAFIKNGTFTYGLVSAGVDNRYGHPHDEVMERTAHLEMFDTSVHGMVRFNIKDGVMCVDTKFEQKNHCIKKRAE
ncbi:DNA internalization-related competence protein ComEC/Rec2 [Salinicoccus siamensis]